jgi:arylsulfatase A-like enzyme
VPTKSEDFQLNFAHATGMAIAQIACQQAWQWRSVMFKKNLLAQAFFLGVILPGLSACSMPPSNHAITSDVSSAHAKTRPNVILIVADDLAWPDISSYGLSTVKTPNLDRIANSGVAFTNGYVAASVCSMSRAAPLTGRMPQESGFHYNLDENHNENQGLPLTETTIANRLHDQGYRTAAIGKWHLGYTAPFYPTRRGFDEFYGFLAGEMMYAPIDTPGIVTTATPYDKPLKHTPAKEIVTGPDATPVNSQVRYLTDVFTDKAVEFINSQNKERPPFFLYLAYNAPHWPMQAPKAIYDRFSDIKDPVRRTYASMITSMDEGIGRVLDTLEAQNLREDTLIIFVSDNGCPIQFGACDCTHPLGSGKFTYVEGGVRVPFLLSWPRALKAQGQVDIPVSTLDILPTVMNAVSPDIQLEQKEGQDLITSAKLKTDDLSRTLLWGQYPVFAARNGKWKLWQSLDKQETQLYDLSTDPAERFDVKEQHGEVATELTRELKAWRDTLPPPLWSRRFVRPLPVCVKTTEWVY